MSDNHNIWKVEVHKYCYVIGLVRDFEKRREVYRMYITHNGYTIFVKSIDYKLNSDQLEEYLEMYIDAKGGHINVEND